MKNDGVLLKSGCEEGERRCGTVLGSRCGVDCGSVVLSVWVSWDGVRGMMIAVLVSDLFVS